MPSRRSLGLVLGVCAAAALLAAIFSLKASRKMPDFEVYWKAAVRARAAEPLYRVEDGHYVLKYLPAFAVLAIPAGLLPVQTGKVVWFTASAVLLVAFLALSLALLPERRRPAWVILTIACVAMAKFYGHELVLGQVNLLLGAMVAGAVVLLRSGREAAAGVLIALAIVIKPYAAIFLPWLAARRRIASIAAAAATLCLILLLPAAVYGFDGNVALLRAWWRTVTESTAPNLLSPDNVSVAAMYAKWIGAGPQASLLATVTAAGLLAVAVVVFIRRDAVRFPEGLECALLLTLMPLLSPQGWDYVFLVSTPAIVYLVNYEDLLPLPVRAGTAVAVAVIGLSIYDVMGRANYAAFMALSVISVCYFVVIAALAAMRVRRIA